MKRKLIILIIITLSLFAILYFGYFFYLNHKNTGGIAVLAYHHFMTEEEKKMYQKDNYNVISVENFEEQLKYLKEHNYNSISIEQLECYMKNECEMPEKAVLITIDDGNISSYYKALPILEKYKFNSAVFVINSRTNKITEECTAETFCFLGEDLLTDIRENHPSMVIGSHSNKLHDIIDGTNPIDILNEDELYEDVKTAKDNLNTTYYAYPFGRYNDKIINALKKAGYTMAFTFKDNKKAKKGDNLFKIPRIEIRGDYNINDFANQIESKITLKEYTKKILKKILFFL